MQQTHDSKRINLENDIEQIRIKLDVELSQKQKNITTISYLQDLMIQKKASLASIQVIQQTSKNKSQNVNPASIQKLAFTSIYDAIEQALLYIISNYEEIKDMANSIGFIPKNKETIINSGIPQEYVDFVYAYLHEQEELIISYDWITTTDSLGFSFKYCCDVYGRSHKTMLNKLKTKYFDNYMELDEIIADYQMLSKYNMTENHQKTEINGHDYNQQNEGENYHEHYHFAQ